MERNDQQFLAQKIRAQYLEKECTELDALRALDGRVRRAPTVFAWVFGSISALIMGSGMSLIMTDIGASIGLQSTMLPGIVIGIIGMLLAIINYPIYQRLLHHRRKKYADQILQLSNRVLTGNDGAPSAAIN